MSLTQTRQKGLLILEDGEEYWGECVGHLPYADPTDKGSGEVVFNTSMTGYQEILTDPSYFGQIVCLTAPHIGNTGVNEDDEESSHPQVSGLLVHEICEFPSSWRKSKSLEHYLIDHQIVALSGVDTRKLTLRLRMEGSIRGMIISEKNHSKKQELLKRLPPFEGRDLVKEVSTKQRSIFKIKKETYPIISEDSEKQLSRHRVAILDFGVKKNILRILSQKNCELTVFPATTAATDLINYDGIFLSNGPGDPSALPYAVETVKALLGKKPIFGICMGHQILGLALGGKTFKLPFGHRGANHPIQSGPHKIEISSQNHGYALEPEFSNNDVEVTHINLNDGTVAGIRSVNLKAFSVQYHPEASPGPHDSWMIFDEFIRLMEEP